MSDAAHGEAPPTFVRRRRGGREETLPAGRPVRRPLPYTPTNAYEPIWLDLIYATPDPKTLQDLMARWETEKAWTRLWDAGALVRGREHRFASTGGVRPYVAALEARGLVRLERGADGRRLLVCPLPDAEPVVAGSPEERIAAWKAEKAEKPQAGPGAVERFTPEAAAALDAARERLEALCHETFAALRRAGALDPELAGILKSFKVRVSVRFTDRRKDGAGEKAP